jgi:hypothetical protein
MQTYYDCFRSFFLPVITNADECSMFVLAFDGRQAAGESHVVIWQQRIMITSALALYYPGAYLPRSRIALHIQPPTTIHASGSAPGFRGENGPYHDSERGRRSGPAVEIFAEPISENDTASSRPASSSGYAKNRTLGRTGMAAYRGDDGNSRPSSDLALQLPTGARAIRLTRISE